MTERIQAVTWRDFRYIILDGEQLILTEEQTKTLAPLPNGRYRVYRYVCQTCSAIGQKTKFDDAIQQAIAHGEHYNHTVHIQGGIFYLD